MYVLRLTWIDQTTQSLSNAIVGNNIVFYFLGSSTWYMCVPLLRCAQSRALLREAQQRCLDESESPVAPVYSRGALTVWYQGHVRVLFIVSHSVLRCDVQGWRHARTGTVIHDAFHVAVVE